MQCHMKKLHEYELSLKYEQVLRINKVTNMICLSVIFNQNVRLANLKIDKWKKKIRKKVK